VQKKEPPWSSLIEFLLHSFLAVRGAKIIFTTPFLGARTFSFFFREIQMGIPCNEKGV